MNSSGEGTLLKMFGLNAGSGSATPMQSHHGHCEIEINILETGWLVYDFSGTKVRFTPGHALVFFAGRMHRIVETDHDTRFYWITLPPVYALQWKLGVALVRDLLAGRVLNLQTDEDQWNTDLLMIRRWCRELRAEDRQLVQIIRLELQARFERLALNSQIHQAGESFSKFQWTVGGGRERVAEMLLCLTSRYTEPLRLKELAKAANLNQDSAASLFQKRTGLSWLEFLTRQRLAHAKWMLLATDTKILDVAMESGFGSESRFYDAFRKSTGMSPGAFRKRWPGV